jgi:hypothetical protein
MKNMNLFTVKFRKFDKGFVIFRGRQCDLISIVENIVFFSTAK